VKNQITSKKQIFSEVSWRTGSLYFSNVHYERSKTSELT